MCGRQLLAALPLVAITVASGIQGQSTDGQSLGDCAVCYSIPYELPPYMDVHFMDASAWVDACSGGAGHGVHDCLNGDAGYFTGNCSTHDPCDIGDLLALVANRVVIPAATARDLARKYPGKARYMASIGRLSVRNCGGMDVTTVKVTSTGTAGFELTGLPGATSSQLAW